MAKPRENFSALAQFQASTEEIDTIFESYRTLHTIYSTSFVKLQEGLNGLPQPYLQKVEYAKRAFNNTAEYANQKQNEISSQLYAQGLVLLVGYSEAHLRELFRTLLRFNLKTLSTSREFTFTLSEIKRAKNDIDLGDILLEKLEDDKNPAEKLNLQNMKTLQGIFSGYFGINIDDDYMSELHKFWQIRHIVIHNAMVIDKKFMDNLKAAGIDTKPYKLGEDIIITKSDYDYCFGLLSLLFEKIDEEIERIGLITYIDNA